MRLDKRQLLGPLFGPLSKLKHSRATRLVTALVWLPSQVIKARHNRPYFAVDISGKKGMGATLVEALLLCHYAEVNRLTPRIISTNPLYATHGGEDFIMQYLGPATPTEAVDLRWMRLRTLWNVCHLDFSHHIPLVAASRIFWTYFAPKPSISRRVDDVLACVPGAVFDLSIHYRGTDKALEASLVQFDIYAAAVLAHVACGGRIGVVFLATDDDGFERYIRQRFPASRFIGYTLGEPTDASRGRHFSNMTPDQKAVEALVNMFLLAAAPVCIRGASYMSAMSKLINPALRTVTLNQTHWGSTEFPEQEILAEERSAMTDSTARAE